MRKNKKILTTTSLGLTVALAIVIASSLVEAIAVAEEKKDANIVNAVKENDDDDDYNAYYKHKHEGGNSTLSATFSIRVTPEHYHIVSWSILWGVFVCSVLFGVYQMHLERKWLKYVQSSSHNNNNNKSSSSSSSSNRNSYRFNNKHSPDPEYGSIAGLSGGRTSTLSKSGRLIRASSRAGTSSSGRMSTSKSSASINSSSNPGNLGDEQAVSSGDISRATFRRLLLFAMLSRTIAIPIQIYSDPLWVQLIADTFPVMAYATAWMWLVSFFVQLVGVALGTNPNPNIGGEGITMSSSSGGSGGGGSSGNGGNSNSTNSTYKPVATIDTVIQITAYTVYALLITTFTVFRRIAAAVLLYALLCCVYATLLGTGLYYCPRLLGLLLPGLGRGSRGSGSADSSPSTSSTATKYYKDPLAIRLGLCTIICLLVFAGRTFCFARKVVQSTGDGSAAMHSGGPYWWFQYGTLEWLPSILILIMIHPKKVITNNSKSGSSNNNSNNSNNSNNNDDNPNQQQHQQPPASGRRTPPLHSYLRQDHSGSKNYNKPSSSPSPSAASSLSLFSAVTLPAETSPLLVHTTLASSSSSVNRYGGVGGGGGGDNNE